MRSLWMRQDDFGGVVQSGVQRFTGSGPYSSAFSGSGGVGLPRYSVSLGVESTLYYAQAAAASTPPMETIMVSQPVGDIIS